MQFQTTFLERLEKDCEAKHGLTVDMILVGPITNEYHKVSCKYLSI